MSQTNAGRPNRRRAVVVLAQDQVKWKAEALMRLGWSSKAAEQQGLSQGLDADAATIQQRALRGQGPHGATAAAPLLDKAGPLFQDFHQRLTQFEQTPADQRAPLLAALTASAQAAVDRFGTIGKSAQADKGNIARRDVALATLRECKRLELAAQVQALPDPPWQSVEAMQATALRVSLDIASLPADKQHADTLGGAHQSPAFWINRQKGLNKEKSFIFKPAAPSGQPGYPDGGEPAREAMGSRVAAMLNGALGFSVPVPDTNMVSLPKESLGAELETMVEDGKLAGQTDYVGSVQQVAQNNGEMRSLGRGQLARIPAQAAQELAIFDTIMLNTDRHAGNFLVKTGPQGEPNLIPIDQGLCLPTRATGSIITANIGSPHNAVLAIPASHEPFTPRAQQALAKLEPDDLAAALELERQTMEQAHPSTAGTISDEAIEMSRRSAMFLRLAAPQLTPAAVQVAIARFQDKLFDPALADNDFNRVAGAIIAQVATELEGLKEYFLMPPEQQQKMKHDLETLGWDVGRFFSGNSILTNPAKALAIWRAGTAPPDVSRDPNRRPRDLGGSDRELADAKAAFPTLTVPTDDAGKRAVLEDWDDWRQLRATPDMVRMACDQIGIRGDNIADTLASLSASVAALRRAAALSRTLAADTTDKIVLRMQQDLGYIEELLPVLAPNDRARPQQLVTTFKTGLQGGQAAALRGRAPALAQMRDVLVDTARSRLLQKYDRLLMVAADEGVKRLIEEERSEVESFDLVGGFRKLTKRAGDAFASS